MQELRVYTPNPEVRWNLSTIAALDSVGAFVLWSASDGQKPQHIEVRAEHLPLFRRWTERQIPQEPTPASSHVDPLAYIARVGRHTIEHGADFVSLVGQFVLDCGLLLRNPAATPWRDISANIFHAGVQALGIVALVGFLTGVVVSYLSSLELRSYGAGNFIVIVSGIGILRELGPVLTAVLVAGRSGSAMAAQLGVMRVTQEMDALAAMGVSQSLRLVLPKIVAMVLVMPLLIVWSDVLAIFGSMCAARATLDMGFVRFLTVFPNAVPLSNFWLGVGKGAVFGLLIALVACHYGLRIRPNTESLGRETTNAVVTAITLAILADAVFAILFRSVGLP
ncbi:MAG TPA: ABC transporter permease [Gammaproteobacteria bacterium]|jgi:phospholipid/cholesterol/gamma-HCH transport system permease protein|nr:ABC transporter permease [Gammaproteobacteria bacterium]